MAEEETTHVIGVEALAHAGRYIEPALQRAEPHHVWNIVAKEPQGPEPREERAGCPAFHAAFHLRHRTDSPLRSRRKLRFQAWSLFRKAFTRARDPQALPVPLPIASAETALCAT